MPKAEIKKDIISELDERPTPQVPDPDMDYLFTNWGFKEPEKPFVKAVNKKDAKEIKDAPAEELGLKKEESIERKNILSEMSLFDGIYKAIMRGATPSTDKEESKGKIYKKIDDIIKASFDKKTAKLSSPKKYDDAELMGINYSVKLNGTEYAIHTHLIKGSKIFMVSLWNKEETRIQEMLCEGYLQEKYYLVGLIKQRLQSYLEKKHGK